MYAIIITRRMNSKKRREALDWAKRASAEINKGLKKMGVEFRGPMTAWAEYFGDHNIVWWTAGADDLETLEKWRKAFQCSELWEPMNQESKSEKLFLESSHQIILKSEE